MSTNFSPFYSRKCSTLHSPSVLSFLKTLMFRLNLLQGPNFLAAKRPLRRSVQFPGALLARSSISFVAQWPRLSSPPAPRVHCFEFFQQGIKLGFVPPVHSCQRAKSWVSFSWLKTKSLREVSSRAERRRSTVQIRAPRPFFRNYREKGIRVRRKLVLLVRASVERNVVGYQLPRSPKISITLSRRL